MKRNRRYPTKFNIIKASGHPEPFNKQKLYKSIKYCGLPNKTCQHIADKVSDELDEGFKTRDIYRKTLNLVKEQSHLAAVHYSLKKALFDLGPSGHNFEMFVAKYFMEKGFVTKTCQTFQGQFVKHEVDVVAEKQNNKHFVECKFHNRQGLKNDIKIALYVKARWDDLKNGPDGKNLKSYYLVSNTSFSTDALAYAMGTGLNLLGVNAPAEKSFLEEIKSMRLYPITSLRNINRHQKNQLISKGIIAAKQILNSDYILKQIGLSDRELNDLKSELHVLLNEAT